VSPEGMHSSPLLRGVPLMGGSFMIEEGERIIGVEEVSRMLMDYIIQGQVMLMVMGLVDKEDGWGGPKYATEHVYGIKYMVGLQLINDITGWDGQNVRWRAWSRNRQGRSLRHACRRVWGSMG
jgi:hypothetical protein